MTKEIEIEYNLPYTGTRFRKLVETNNAKIVTAVACIAPAIQWVI